jgi:hypothetical protein
MSKHLLLLAFLAMTMGIAGDAQAQTPTPDEICNNIPAGRLNLIVICDIWRQTAVPKRKIYSLQPLPQNGCRNFNLTDPNTIKCLKQQANAACKKQGYDGAQAWDARGGGGAEFLSWNWVNCYN